MVIRNNPMAKINGALSDLCTQWKSRSYFQFSLSIVVNVITARSHTHFMTKNLYELYLFSFLADKAMGDQIVDCIVDSSAENSGDLPKYPNLPI